jgi:hypothetical protein
VGGNAGAMIDGNAQNNYQKEKLASLAIATMAFC